MASNAQIEMFAYDVFHSLYFHYKLISYKPDISEIYGEECLAVPEYRMVCCSSFVDAIHCRFDIFNYLFLPDILDNVQEFQNSSLDFNNYIQRSCDRVDWFGHLTIFDRMFATCTFVWMLCFYCTDVSPPIEWAKYSHICWAMFFDKYADEFYESGGWRELGRIARRYTLTYQFLKMLRPPRFHEIKPSLDRFANFKHLLEFNNCEKGSKLWIKFNIAQLRSCSDKNPSYDPAIYLWSKSFCGMESYLQRLMFACNPSTPNNSVSAPQSQIEAKTRDDYKLAKIHNTLSIPLSTETKRIEMSFQSFKPESFLLKSDNLNFPSSLVRNEPIPASDMKISSNLFDVPSNNPKKIDNVDFNRNNNRTFELKNLDLKTQIKSHSDRSRLIDIHFKINSNPVDSRENLPNAMLELTEDNIYKNEVLKEEPTIETLRTGADNICERKKVYFKDLGLEVMENILTSDTKLSNKESDFEKEKREMVRQYNGKVSPSGDFGTNDLQNILAIEKKPSVKGRNIEVKTDKLSHYGDARTDVTGISISKKGRPKKKRNVTIDKESNEIKDFLKMILILGDESSKCYALPTFQKSSFFSDQKM